MWSAVKWCRYVVSYFKQINSKDKKQKEHSHMWYKCEHINFLFLMLQLCISFMSWKPTTLLLSFPVFQQINLHRKSRIWFWRVSSDKVESQNLVVCSVKIVIEGHNFNRSYTTETILDYSYLHFLHIHPSHENGYSHYPSPPPYLEKQIFVFTCKSTY